MDTDTQKEKESTGRKTGADLGVFNFLSSQRGLIIMITCAALAITTIYVLFEYTQDLLISRYRDYAVTVATSASSQISSSEIKYSLRDGVVADELNEKLNLIVSANEKIESVYLVRSVGELEVVHSLSPDIDVMKINVIAPISDNSGNKVAMLGVDIIVDDFGDQVRTTLLPFLVCTLALSFILTVLIIFLAGVWEERVKMERELDKKKEEILSVVSHQLATPVSSVKWYIEMMLDGDVGKLTEEQRRHIETMASVTEGLGELINMLLDVSRIELGHAQSKISTLSLETLIEDVLRIIEPKAKQKEIVITKNITDALPTVEINRRLMRMILDNLLGNAIKYTPKGKGVKFTFQVRGKEIFIEVEDEGCGIPEDEQDKVYNKLFRASNASEIPGHGFGLYVVKNAVESLGGHIEFISEQNEGTTFKVNVPIDN